MANVGDSSVVLGEHPREVCVWGGGGGGDEKRDLVVSSEWLGVTSHLLYSSQFSLLLLLCSHGQ